MARPMYRLSGRSRMRRPWLTPWRKRKEYEIYMVVWDSRFVWFTRDQISVHCPGLLNILPE